MRVYISYKGEFMEDFPFSLCKGILLTPFVNRGLGYEIKKIADIPIIVDSGGFQLTKKSLISCKNRVYKDWKPIDIFKKQIEVGGDFFVVLDVPPTDGNAKKAIELTLKNTEELLKTIGDKYKIIPVLHGSSSRDIKECFKGFSRMAIEYGYEFEIFAIGGLVRFTAGRIKNCNRKFAEILTTARDVTEGYHLHAFGMGSPLMLKLARFFEIDSTDTRSWVINAWFRLVFTPGEGRKRVDNLSDINCTCPICENYGLEGLKTSRKLRALHNLYLILEEATKLENIDPNDLRKYILNNKFLKRYIGGLLTC